MADESQKGTSDPLRDAIIAQGKADQERRKPPAPPLWCSPTEDEFNEWFAPLDVLDVSDIRMADDSDKWEIIEQLRAGQILAVARTAQTVAFTGGVRPFVLVPVDAWHRTGQVEEYHFWKTGHLVVPGVHRQDDYGGVLTGDKERYFNIRFDPESFNGRPPQLSSDCPPPQPPPQPPPPNPIELVRAGVPQKNKGGRPKYDYWEPLLIEIGRQLYAGDLQPIRQAQIEGAMQEWITAQGKEWSETQVRLRAKSLWEAIEKEVGK